MLHCKWLEYARRDLEIAQIIYREGYYGEATFHAQQAAEKALKAVLTSLGIQPPKTHVIEYLLHILEKKGVQVGNILDAGRLTDYAVASRYPDFEEEPGREEAEEALEIAGKVVEWATRILESRSGCTAQGYGTRRGHGEP